MAFVTELTYTSPEIISLARAKKQLQLESDFTEDDALISDYIDAAISQAENYINTEISEKKFDVKGTSINDVLAFNQQKITSVDLFTYKDLNGTNQTIAATDYSLQSVDKYENKIVFNDDFVYPEIKAFDPAAVNLQVTVGFSVGKVPKAIQKALLLMVTDSYEFRNDTVKEKSTASENALHPYKRF